MKEEYLSFKKHIQNVIGDREDIVNNHPYHAFALLTVLIEVFGKCVSGVGRNEDGKSERHKGAWIASYACSWKYKW